MNDRRVLFKYQLVHLTHAPIAPHLYILRFESSYRPSKLSERFAYDRNKLRVIGKESGAKPINSSSIVAAKQQTKMQRLWS